MSDNKIIDKLKEKMKELEEANKKLQKLAEELETTKTDLEKTTIDNEKKKTESENKIQQLLEEKKQKDEEIKKLKEQIDNKIISVDDNKIINKLKDKLKELEETKKQLETAKADLENIKKDIDKKIEIATAAKDKEIANLKEQLKNKDNNDQLPNPKIDLLKDRLKKLEEKLKNKEQEIEDIKNDPDTIEDINDHIVEKEAIKKQIENMKNQISKLIEEDERNKTHLINCKILQKQLEEINKKLDNNGGTQSDAECCKKINEKLDQLLLDNNDKKQQEIEKLNKKIEEKNMLIKELEEKIKKNNTTTSQEIKDKLNEIEKNKNDLLKEKEQAIKDGDYERAAKIDQKIKDLNQEQEKLEKAKEEQELKEKENKVLEEKLKQIQIELEQTKKEKTELEEKINNNNNNNNCSKDEIIGEFTIEKVTSLEDFNSSNNIREIINNKIRNLYPNAVINKDYKIEFENLNNTDIIQGKEIKIKIKPIKDGKVKEGFNFIIKIKYNYDIQEQKNAATRILRKAIPSEFWNDRNNKNYPTIWRNNTRYPAIASMIRNVKPLPILLNESHITSKIMAETFSASYWSNYNTEFWGLWIGADNGYWPTETNVPTSNTGNKIINVKTLYELNNTYFNKLFFIIEKHLNDSGIKCRVSKKAIKDYYDTLYLYGVGNIEFNNKEDINYDDKTKDGKQRQYYIQVSFDVIFFDKDDSSGGSSQEYAGVVLTLTDELTLYS